MSYLQISTMVRNQKEPAATIAAAVRWSFPGFITWRSLITHYTLPPFDRFDPLRSHRRHFKVRHVVFIYHLTNFDRSSISSQWPGLQFSRTCSATPAPVNAREIRICHRRGNKRRSQDTNRSSFFLQKRVFHFDAVYTTTGKELSSRRVQKWRARLERDHNYEIAKAARGIFASSVPNRTRSICWLLYRIPRKSFS